MAPPLASPPRSKVAIILDGPANDGGWNASCYQAMLDAANELGWETAYSESVETANWARPRGDYLDQGFDLLFMPGNEFTDVSKQVGADYPDAHICLLNSEVSSSNIVGLVPDTKQIGLLAGALAGILSKTGHIGFIGGVELDTTKNKLDYYTKAAQKVNPDIQVFSAYANSFMDAGKGKEIAASMLTTNSVDVMFGDASIVDTGAREALSAYSDRYDIGQPADLGSADDKLIANSVVTDNKTMLKESMQDVESGELRRQGHLRRPLQRRRLHGHLLQHRHRRPAEAVSRVRRADQGRHLPVGGQLGVIT